MRQREAVKCNALILGPRMGPHVVLWRKNCARWTKHESGKCRDHRKGFGPFGPGAR